MSERTSIESVAAPRPARRRPEWRAWLADAERGLVLGIRGDSRFFVHFFVGSVVLAGGLVWQIAPWQWAVIVVAWSMVVACELLNQAVRELANALPHDRSDAGLRAKRMATAGVFAAILGATLVNTLVFAHRLWEVFLA